MPFIMTNKWSILQGR